MSFNEEETRFHLIDPVLVIPAPEIDEQRRSVARLKSQLAEATAIAQAAAQLAEIDRLPQRILAQAFAGSA